MKGVRFREGREGLARVRNVWEAWGLLTHEHPSPACLVSWTGPSGSAPAAGALGGAGRHCPPREAQAAGALMGPPLSAWTRQDPVSWAVPLPAWCCPFPEPSRPGLGAALGLRRAGGGRALAGPPCAQRELRHCGRGGTEGPGGEPTSSPAGPKPLVKSLNALDARTS